MNSQSRSTLKKNYGPSSSGKTTIVASTNGGIKLDGPGNINLNLNLYKKPEKE